MLLIFLCYLFNFFFYSVTIYFSLLLMEKLGKKRPSAMVDRASFAAVLAVGPTMIQLIANAASMIYSGWIH